MPLKLSELRTHDEVLSEELQDPDFRAEWDRLALARAVGRRVLQYRQATGLSQRKLALQLGMKQPQIARLEAGTHDPSFETLQILCARLDMEFLVDISPRSGRRWVKSKPPQATLFEATELQSGTRIAVAAR